MEPNLDSLYLLSDRPVILEQTETRPVRKKTNREMETSLRLACNSAPATHIRPERSSIMQNFHSPGSWATIPGTMTREGCKCFAAYPSTPACLAATIKEAISQLNGSGMDLDVTGWHDLKVAGKLIIAEVCQAIDSADVVIADVTTLNHNVLFELGYAIARKKQVWPILDPSYKDAERNYHRFRTLTSIGYAPYTNVNELLERFMDKAPCKDRENTVFHQAVERNSGSGQRRLLYVRSSVDTEASIQLSRKVDAYGIPVVVDDPNEVRIRPFTWYVQQIMSQPPVLAHFLSTTREGADEHNAKASFVCGFAHGIGCRVFMLAEAPYETPLDYSDLLEIHDTPAQCISLAEAWLQESSDELRRDKTLASEHARKIKKQSRLQQLSVGAYVAEEEAEELPRYFVPIASYRVASRERYSLVVGQKGSGKSAILYKLLADTKGDTRNATCVIKPVAFELEGLLEMVSAVSATAERGYLIQSLWKFLIYTELARSLRTTINLKSQFSEREEHFLALLDKQPDIFSADFSVRLESVVNRLSTVAFVGSASDMHLRVSELLHENLIPKLRGFLGELLKKKPKILLLIDDLDKGWAPSKSIDKPCELFAGLLDVGQSIAHDFASARPRNPSAKVQVIIFLRNDMFAEIRRRSPERDKLTHTPLEWDDPELLIRVLENRLLPALGDNVRPDLIWGNVFPSIIDGCNIKDYVLQRILQRPRDLLYFANQALSIAVNRGREQVTARDVMDALRAYSKYAYEMLTVGRIQFKALEELIYQFVGSPRIIDETTIMKAMRKAEISSMSAEQVEDALCELEFLGREVEKGVFRFVHRQEEIEKAKILAGHLLEAQSECAVSRFEINVPYHAFLEIQE